MSTFGFCCWSYLKVEAPNAWDIVCQLLCIPFASTEKVGSERLPYRQLRDVEGSGTCTVILFLILYLHKMAAI